MRSVYSTAVCIFLLFPVLSFCQEQDQSQPQVPLQEEQPPESVAVDTGIGFCYSVIESKVGESRFDVSHDTLFFRLYYVDNTCTNFKYTFKRDGKSFVVRRVTENPANCFNNEEQLYAVEGKLFRLPKGKYLFELESSMGENTNSLYREVFVVK